MWNVYRPFFPSFLALTLSLARLVSSGSTCYQRELSIVGADFFEQFNWETENDPTQGRVNYLSLDQAKAKNLTYATEDKFFMLPDSKNVVEPGARGRDSNRISSKQSFDESVVVVDVQHMPYGCATWPAFWSYSKTDVWPIGGEIDIIEGVNEVTKNQMTLHTLPNCTMPENRVQSGTTISTNCDANYNYNQGCATQAKPSISYGKNFNEAGGGFYALARSKDYGIKIWFWSREEFVPPDVQEDCGTVDPDWWGEPAAFFPTGDSCVYGTHFDAHMLVFDLTFCGDWAGSDSVWAASGCSSMTCSDFVDKNPQAFADAYWEVNSLRVYLPSGN